MEKCPVCDWKLEGQVLPETHHEGRSYRFCSDDCKSKLDKSPKGYLANALAQENSDREKIVHHIDELFKAFIRKDLGAIRRGHTSDWKGFQVGSRHLVRGIDEYMEAAQQVLKNFDDRRYEMLDLDVQVHGDVAVVFYLAKVWIAVPSGGEQAILLRSVDIYRKEPQGWNQCGSNICTAKGKEATPC